MTALAETRVCIQLEEILEIRMTGAFVFGPAQEKAWAEAYGIDDPRRNPVRQIFEQLDSIDRNLS